MGKGFGAANLTYYTPSGWDYPIVPSSIPNTHSVDTLYGNQITYIDWAIQNNEDANAGEFKIDLYIDGSFIQRWSQSILSVGHWTHVDDWQRTLNVGYHTLKIVIDATNAISESNEDDNSYERQFYWAQGDIAPPSTPANLTVANPANDDGTHLDLTWNASTDNVTIAYYRVYESTSPNVSKEIWDAYYEPKTNNLQAYDLTRGVKYYYKVSAIDTSGNESSLSNRAEGIPKDTRKPNTPTNLSALASDGYVSLRWDYAWDAYRWNLYRKPGINTPDYERIDYTGINSFIDYKVTNGTTYYYGSSRNIMGK
ncbi:MAG: CARDB domain-containing protein, partial [bacterium]